MAKTHTDGPAMATLVAKLKPIEIGPADIRIHQAHMVTPPKAPNANDLIIISHVDVAGGGNLAKLITMLNTLGEASQKDKGMVRYEILDEVPAHANHMRVLEEWSSPAAWEAHNLAPHTQAYHDALLPLLGTPYDQRLYRAVN
jgi:quinol monooxygenase YgiN